MSDYWFKPKAQVFIKKNIAKKMLKVGVLKDILSENSRYATVRQFKRKFNL